MTTTFNLPENVRFTEELGLHLVFQDVKIRGSEDSYAQVIVTEEGSAIDVTDTYSFNSWESMKKSYPTMLDFLKKLSENEFWTARWCYNDRIFLIASSVGHEGLYDMTETVWFDAKEQEAEQEDFDEQEEDID